MKRHPEMNRTRPGDGPSPAAGMNMATRRTDLPRCSVHGCHDGASHGCPIDVGGELLLVVTLCDHHREQLQHLRGVQSRGHLERDFLAPRGQVASAVRRAVGRDLAPGEPNGYQKLFPQSRSEEPELVGRGERPRSEGPGGDPRHGSPPGEGPRPRTHPGCRARGRHGEVCRWPGGHAGEQHCGAHGLFSAWQRTYRYGGTP